MIARSTPDRIVAYEDINAPRRLQERVSDGDLMREIWDSYHSDGHLAFPSPSPYMPPLGQPAPRTMPSPTLPNLPSPTLDDTSHQIRTSYHSEAASPPIPDRSDSTLAQSSPRTLPSRTLPSPQTLPMLLPDMPSPTLSSLSSLTLDASHEIGTPYLSDAGVALLPFPDRSDSTLAQSSPSMLLPDMSSQDHISYPIHPDIPDISPSMSDILRQTISDVPITMSSLGRPNMSANVPSPSLEAVTTQVTEPQAPTTPGSSLKLVQSNISSQDPTFPPYDPQAVSTGPESPEPIQSGVRRRKLRYKWERHLIISLWTACSIDICRLCLSWYLGRRGWEYPSIETWIGTWILLFLQPFIFYQNLLVVPISVSIGDYNDADGQYSVYVGLEDGSTWGLRRSYDDFLNLQGHLIADFGEQKYRQNFLFLPSVVERTVHQRQDLTAFTEKILEASGRTRRCYLLLAEFLFVQRSGHLELTGPEPGHLSRFQVRLEDALNTEMVWWPLPQPEQELTCPPAYEKTIRYCALWYK